MYQESITNQFNTVECKSLIGDAFDEIASNTAIKHCLNTITPYALSSADMGRVSSKMFRWHGYYVQLQKHPKRITRRIRVGDVSVEVSLNRPVKYTNGTRQPTDVDALKLDISVIDVPLFERLTGVSTYDKGFYMTDALYLFKWESGVHQFPIDDSKTVREIVMGDIVNEFKANTNKILDDWQDRLTSLRAVNDSFTKYL